LKIFLYYILAMLYFQTNGTCSGLAKVLNRVSHDSLNRFLRRQWSGQKRLEAVIEPEKMKGGYLIIDDTPIEKPYSKKLEGLWWIYSSTERKVVYGYCLVLLIWTDGKIRIPIGLRLWRRGGKTKIELALELLSHARNHLGLKPEYVFFDSWYASKKLFKRIKDYGWYFVTRLKRNRRFNGVSLNRIGWRNHFQGTGWISGGLKVKVVKNDNKFLASNKLSLGRKEMERLYLIRSIIEEVNRILKQVCCLKGCQARSIEAQEHHMWCSLFAFAVLERESKRLNMTVYKLRNDLCRRDSMLCLPLLERLKKDA